MGAMQHKATRSREKAVAARRRRQRVQVRQAVARHPGIGIRGLRRATGIHPQFLRIAVSDLVAQGRLVEARRGGATTLWLKAPTHAEVERAAIRVRSAALDRLSTWAEVNPGARQADAVRHAAREWRWPKSTTQWRWNRLQELQACG